MFKNLRTKTADSHSLKPAYIYIYIAFASLIIGLLGIIGLNWSANASTFPEVQEQTIEGNSATTHMALKADDTKLNFICPSVINFAMKANGEFITPSAGQAYIENLSLMPLRMKSYTVTSDPAAKGMISTASATDDNAYEVKVKTQLGNPTPFAVTQSALTSSEWSMTKAGGDTSKLDLTFSDGKMVNITNRWGTGAHLQDVVWNATADINNQVTVQFDSTGGSVIPDQTLTTGDKATAPTAPTRDGFEFAGWFTDSACTQAFDFAGTNVNQYTLLFAKWERTFTGLTMIVNAPSQVSYTHNPYAEDDSDVKVKIKGRDTDFRKVGSDEIQNLGTGDIMFVKGANPNGFSHFRAVESNTDGAYNHFNIIGDTSLSGNINSLLDDNDGANVTNIPVNQCYHGTFHDCPGITSLLNFSLPATGLTEECYGSMFSNCSGLTSLPEGLLPATELANSCYYSMFYDCSGLSSLPAGLLPATELADRCYSYMFAGCSGLTSLPEGLLPATELADYCYHYMFYGCSGLSSLPAGLLPATQLANYCYHGMFESCSGLTNLPADLLPATQLVDSCYGYMFYGCSKLKIRENDSSSGTLIFTCPDTSGLNDPTFYMFRNTAGDFKGTPTTGNSYYCYQ